MISIVLARLLGPKPFGQIAVAFLILGFANIIGGSGFSSALVHSPELSERQIRVIFTVQVLIAAIIVAVIFGAAPLVSVAFHDGGITPVMRGLAPIFLLQALGQTSTGLLKRKLHFRTVQGASVGSYLLGYILFGIPAAYLGAGVWSLVGAQLLQSLSYSGIVYFRARHSLVPCIDGCAAGLAKFGGKVIGTNFVNWGISNLDNAVVGSAFGSIALGLYSRAFNLASLPGDGIVGTCQQVLFPAYSRVQDRAEALRRTYLASLGFVAAIMLPAFWTMAACAPSVVVGLYGDKWTAAIPLFRPLAIAIPINAVMALAGPVLWGTNRVQQEFKAQFAAFVVAIAGFLVATRFSVVALAWFVVAAYAFRFFVVTRPTLRVLDLSWWSVFKAMRGAAVFGLITTGSGYVASEWLAKFDVRPAFALAITASTGALVFVLGMALGFSKILPQELLDLAGRVSDQLPKFVSTRLKKLAAGRERQPEGTASPLFIATIMTKHGETGVHTHFNTVSEYLSEKGVPVEVLTPNETLRWTQRVIWRMVRVVRAANPEMAAYIARPLISFCLLYRLRLSLPPQAPWIVYAQCPLSARAALKMRRQTNQKVILVVHFNVSQANEMADRGRIRNGGWVYRRIREEEADTLRKVDGIVYCSEFMRAQLVQRIPGLAQKKAIVLPNFVSVPIVTESGPAGDIITIGSLEPRKNQAYLFRILAEAKRMGKNYSLTVVGKGENEAELKSLGRELGIAEQVTFAGFVPAAASLMPKHRVYAHTAKIENLPLTLVEAFSAGLPVLAAPVGGIPEILDDGVQGYLWPLDDSADAAAKLIAILENKEVFQKMSCAARLKYESKFRAQDVVPRLYEFLKSTSGDGGSELKYAELTEREVIQALG